MRLIESIEKFHLVFLFIAVFLAGFAANSIIASLNIAENPLSMEIFSPAELISPANHIERENIHVYQDRVVLEIPGMQWAEFTDTNSMDPVIDIEANSFEIVPQSTDDINVGDIIAYKPNNFEGLIVHRVIKTNEDSEGWYAITKGDNVSNPDPDKVRFEQISGLLVGIVY